MDDNRLTLTDRVRRVEQAVFGKPPGIFHAAERGTQYQEDLHAVATDQAEPARDRMRRVDYNTAVHQKMAASIERQMRGEDLAPKVSFTAFQEITDRIQKGTVRVHQSASTLEEIGKRIMGQLPDKDGDQANAVRIEPDGTLDHALLALNRLDESFARLEAASLRLEML